eukprot:2179039-Pleurochrysis_carterae.AAC.8
MQPRARKRKRPRGGRARARTRPLWMRERPRTSASGHSPHPTLCSAMHRLQATENGREACCARVACSSTVAVTAALHAHRVSRALSKAVRPSSMLRTRPHSGRRRRGAPASSLEFPPLLPPARFEVKLCWPLAPRVARTQGRMQRCHCRRMATAAAQNLQVSRDHVIGRARARRISRRFVDSCMQWHAQCLHILHFCTVR